MVGLTIDEGITRCQQELLRKWQGKLRSGEWGCGSVIGGDLSLSREFGYSRTVVRRVLDLLSAKGCITKIPRCGIRIEEEFGISEDMVGSGEHGKILFVRWADNTFFLDVLAGAMAAANDSGYEIVQQMVRQDEASILSSLESLPSDCTSVIIAPVETERFSSALQSFVSHSGHVVQIDRYLEGVEAPSVVFDNYSGASLATRELLDHVPAPVWFLGQREPVSAGKRFAGWRDQLSDYGYVNWPDYVIDLGDTSQLELMSRDQVRRQVLPLLEAFLRSHEDTLSILAMSDIWASYLYDACHGCGRVIGRDVFVCGFDDLPLCTRLKPSLSSVSVDYKAMGRAAVELLSDQAVRSSQGVRILPVDLKVRASSRG